MKNAFNKRMYIVLISSLLLAGCGSNKAEEVSSTTESTGEIQERKFKLGVGLNENHSEGLGAKKFKEIVEEKSEGKFDVSLYFNNQLGDDLQTVNNLKAGTQELGVISTSPLTSMVKEFGVFDLPFAFNTEEEAYAVLDGSVGTQLLEKLPDQKLIGLGYWENGFRNMTNSKHPIETLEDFKGLKIRTMPNEVHLDVFNKLGSNPLPMAFSEVFTAMETKTIDGQENPLPTIELNKFNEVQTYLSMTNHVYTPFIFMASEKFWNELSEDERTIIQEAVIESGKYQREQNLEQNKASLEKLKELGMKVNEFSDEEKEKVKEAIAPVIEKHSAQIGQELVDEMYAEIEKMRQ
ncbi:TRAP transporter substrate-binding protein [Domibacillus indicus]|uniref:TRAP transporter substrate-binding protein n=1 Tax=Domibacillus indicus TaxID=1437523 RepID=UPI00203F6DDC|nr:TRAP transporter substrate-binding protein [Domibacillus indicus]MCM3790536.1 TRAP transporter substrate-binding protein [Domibacillus indicus]